MVPATSPLDCLPHLSSLPPCACFPPMLPVACARSAAPAGFPPTFFSPPVRHGHQSVLASLSPPLSVPALLPFAVPFNAPSTVSLLFRARSSFSCSWASPASWHAPPSSALVLCRPCLLPSHSTPCSRFSPAPGCSHSFCPAPWLFWARRSRPPCPPPTGIGLCRLLAVVCPSRPLFHCLLQLAVPPSPPAACLVSGPGCLVAS